MQSVHSSSVIDKLIASKRRLPKLQICATRSQTEDLKCQILYGVQFMDAKGVRRHKQPLHECLILEAQEAGYIEAAQFLKDLIYDNIELLAADDIGIVVDIRKRPEYLKRIALGLQEAEKYKDQDDPLKECREMQKLAKYFSLKEKGILWLADKFYLTSIAVGSQLYNDGGREKECCKYYYAKFLSERFPFAALDIPLEMFITIRDASVGRNWKLCYPEEADEGSELLKITLFEATSIELHYMCLKKAWFLVNEEPSKAESYARLGAKRAIDAGRIDLEADAMVAMGVCQLALKNVKRANKTLKQALKMYTDIKNKEGICETLMHMASVMQKTGKIGEAVLLLSEMGRLALSHHLRKHLGMALHLLGELHLKDAHPELATEYFDEAFKCFMGYNFAKQPMNPGESQIKLLNAKVSLGKLGVIYQAKKSESILFFDAADQSRFMFAVSAGLEIMKEYFDLLRRSDRCVIANLNVIEWKLTRMGWWTAKGRHDFVACLCSEHKRNIFDALKSINARKNKPSVYSEDFFANIIGTDDNLNLKRVTGEESLKTIASAYKENSGENMTEIKS